MKSKILLYLFFFLSYLTYQLPCFALDNSAAAIQKRIQPVGQVNVEQEEQAAAATTTSQQTTQTAVAKKVDGKVIFESNCKLCHETGVAGAPKVGDANAWKSHIAKGLPVLLANATKGINAMPPKGGCVKCTSDDLMAAIKYMTDQSK